VALSPGCLLNTVSVEGGSTVEIDIPGAGDPGAQFFGAVDVSMESIAGAGIQACGAGSEGTLVIVRGWFDLAEAALQIEETMAAMGSLMGGGGTPSRSWGAVVRAEAGLWSLDDGPSDEGPMLGMRLGIRNREPVGLALCYSCQWLFDMGERTGRVQAVTASVHFEF